MHMQAITAGKKLRKKCKKSIVFIGEKLKNKKCAKII